MTTVLKLGGSVVTEKDEPETVDEASLKRAAEAVASGAATTDLVVVHGGGSFGHHHADAHGVSAETGTRDAAAVRDVHRAMGELNDAVVDALADAGAPAVPVRPLSAAVRDTDAELRYAAAPVAALRDEGFLPVLHGDVVCHKGAGATILSGDELVVELADALDADRVGVCSSVPGVLDESGEVVPTVEEYADVVDLLGASEATDVTGGMAGKVRALLGLDAPAAVFGPADLPAFLAGEWPGTRLGSND